MSFRRLPAAARRAAHRLPVPMGVTEAHQRHRMGVADQRVVRAASLVTTRTARPHVSEQTKFTLAGGRRARCHVPTASDRAASAMPKAAMAMMSPPDTAASAGPRRAGWRSRARSSTGHAAVASGGPKWITQSVAV